MPTRSEVSVNSITTTQVSPRRKFWLFIGLVSFLCALGIFTESQFYAYTIGIHGTYAHIIYYVVGVTLSAAILVLLIQPSCCKDFLGKYEEIWFLKSFGDYLVMFTICFLSSGTGLPYLGLSSDGKAPSPAVAGASAPYRSKAFSEIAGLLASALLTVNAVSIIRLLRTAEHNTFFGVAASLTMKSAIALLYKYPYLTIVAAVFILAMTLLKDFLIFHCCDKAARKEPAGKGEEPKEPAARAGKGKQPAGKGKEPAGNGKGKEPKEPAARAGKKPAGKGKEPAARAGKKPAGKGKEPAARAGKKPAAKGKEPARKEPAGDKAHREHRIQIS